MLLCKTSDHRLYQHQSDLLTLLTIAYLRFISDLIGWSELGSLLLGLVVLLLLFLSVVLTIAVSSLSSTILTSSITVRATVCFVVLLELQLLLLCLLHGLQHLSTLLVRRRFGTLLIGLAAPLVVV